MAVGQTNSAPPILEPILVGIGMSHWGYGLLPMATSWKRAAQTPRSRRKLNLQVNPGHPWLVHNYATLAAKCACQCKYLCFLACNVRGFAVTRTMRAIGPSRISCFGPLSAGHLSHLARTTTSRLRMHGALSGQAAQLEMQRAVWVLA